MKLGILCTMINGFGRKGFYNTQEIGLGRALAQKGNEVVIYKCLKKEKDMRKEKIEIEQGLTLYYLPTSGLGAHGYLKTAVIAKNLDGILCFADNQVFLPHIYRFCKRNGICFVPYVGTTFSLHKGIHAKVMDAWFAMGTLEIFKKNSVIAKTETAKKELENLGVKDISVAPVGLDTAVLKNDFKSYNKVKLREQMGFCKDDVILCNVSRLEPEKRPLDLLRIFNHVKEKKNFQLLLIGEGSLRQAVNEKIVEYGIEDRVKIINRIPYGEMWKIYTISDYFINLNKSEIFGMAIMEAIYYETSVAAVAAPGPSLTLNGMQGHCLCENDQQIEEWLASEYPNQEVLETSAAEVIRKFSWNSCAETFAAIVRRSSHI